MTFTRTDAGGPLLVGEGVPDALVAAVAGFRAAAIIDAASISAATLDELAGAAGPIGLVLALDNDHADSKAHLAIRWRQRHPDVQALLIDDTDHDAAVAREAGICCVLVEGGHQGADALSRCGVPVCPDIPAVYRWCVTQP